MHRYTISQYGWEDHRDYLLIHAHKKTQDELRADLHLAIKKVAGPYLDHAGKSGSWVTADDWIEAGIEYMKKHLGYADAPEDTAFVTISDQAGILDGRKGEHEEKWRKIVGPMYHDDAIELNKRLEKKSKDFRI